MNWDKKWGMALTSNSGAEDPAAWAARARSEYALTSFGPNDGPATRTDWLFYILTSNYLEKAMSEDTRCCGTGTCLINAEGLCWCGQRWNGDTLSRPAGDETKPTWVPETDGEQGQEA
jgi:hypothetical protein